MTLLEEQRGSKGKSLRSQQGQRTGLRIKGQRGIPQVKATEIRKVSRRGGPGEDTLTQGGDKNKNRAICKRTHPNPEEWMSEWDVEGS